MAVIRLTKEFSFEAAHALDGYDGPCREIHGHSYRLFVTVKDTPAEDASNPKCGMVLDFGVLKRIVSEEIVSHFDHALVLRASESGEEFSACSPNASAMWLRWATSRRARTCSAISPPASPRAFPKVSRSTRCVCTRRRHRSPSGSPRTICKKTGRDSGCGGFVKMAAAGKR